MHGTSPIWWALTVIRVKVRSAYLRKPARVTRRSWLPYVERDGTPPDWEKKPGLALYFKELRAETYVAH